MMQDLLSNLTADEQRAFFNQFSKQETTDKDPKDGNDSDDSFHSATSCENVMKCDASPFVMPPSSSPSTNLQCAAEPEESPEIELQKQSSNILQDKLNKQVVVMKAQHQFI